MKFIVSENRNGFKTTYNIHPVKRDNIGLITFSDLKNVYPKKLDNEVKKLGGKILEKTFGIEIVFDFKSAAEVMAEKLSG